MIPDLSLRRPSPYPSETLVVRLALHPRTQPHPSCSASGQATADLQGARRLSPEGGGSPPLSAKAMWGIWPQTRESCSLQALPPAFPEDWVRGVCLSTVFVAPSNLGY